MGHAAVPGFGRLLRLLDRHEPEDDLRPPVRGGPGRAELKPCPSVSSQRDEPDLTPGGRHQGSSVGQGWSLWALRGAARVRVRR